MIYIINYNKKVKYKNVDKNDILNKLTKFGFCRFSCAIESVGSLEKSKELIRNMLKTLKLGGIAVHITEVDFNNENM